MPLVPHPVELLVLLVLLLALAAVVVATFLVIRAAVPSAQREDRAELLPERSLPPQ